MFDTTEWQNRFWLEWKLDPNSTTYNTPLIYKIKGKLNITALKQALNSLVNEYYEGCRTCFLEKNEKIFQVIHNKVNVELIEAKKINATRNNLNIFVDRIMCKPFNLEKLPLFRFGLLKTSNISHLLVLNFHHIIIDATTGYFVTNTLSALYNHYSFSFPKPDLPVKSISDCLKEEKKMEDNKAIDYWVKLLGKRSLSINLPFVINKQTQSKKAKSIYFKLSDSDTEKIKDRARKLRTTPFILLISVFAILLGRYCNLSNVVFHYPINMRPKGFKDLTGCFVNDIPVVAELHNNLTFAELVQQLTLQRKTSNQYMSSFTDIITSLRKKNNLYDIEENLFNVLLVETMLRAQPLEMLGVKATPFFMPDSFSMQQDLAICYEQTHNEILFRADFKQFYNETLIIKFIESFQLLLSAATNNPEANIYNLPLLSETEYRTIVYNWNMTEASYPKEKIIHQLFEEQVEKTPDNVAIVFEGNKLTYRELNGKANQLAHFIRSTYLKSNGVPVKSDTPIGIYIERSLEMIIGILGILKSGAAYVPFDTADPETRLVFKINDSACKMIITSIKSFKNLSLLTEGNTLPVSINPISDQLLRFPKNNPVHINKSTDLAYIIYTSGSTGQPKGVMIEHKSVNNLINEEKKLFHIKNRKKILQFSSISFDASVFEIFVSLCTGSVLYVVDEKTRQDTFKLSSLLSEKKINIATLPPVIFNELNKNSFSCIENIVVAGDVTKQKAMESFEGKTKRLLNAYGPTENTVCASVKIFKSETSNRNIGRPLSNIQLYILSNTLYPVPVGVTGHLYIGGVGLARGYLNDLGLTKQKFISNPFATDNDKKLGHNLRLYKTGDLCRYLPGGDIEFIGRNDDQIKIRGFRVELGEIESKLSSYPIINQCAVLCKERNSGEKYLVAYYTANAKMRRCVNAEKLREYLSNILPNYMIPSVFVQLDKMPLNTSKKIDKNALIVPEIINEESFVPPSSEEEKIITQIWEKIFGINKIGIADNFFFIGGNSINAIKLASELSKAFLRTIPVVMMFQKRTIKEQAKEIARATVMPDKNVVYLNTSTTRSKGTLIFFPPAFSGAEAYCCLTDKLNSNFRIIGINNYFLNNPNRMFTSGDKILYEYLDKLKKDLFQNLTKPVYLAGWSLGGNTALSISRFMKHLNINGVFLFDSLSPKAAKRYSTDLQRKKYYDPDNSFFVRFKDAGYSRSQIISTIKKIDTYSSSLKYEKSNIKLILFKAIQKTPYRKTVDENNGWNKYFTNIQKIDISSANHFNILTESNSIKTIAKEINNVLLDNIY